MTDDRVCARKYSTSVRNMMNWRNSLGLAGITPLGVSFIRSSNLSIERRAALHACQKLGHYSDQPCRVRNKTFKARAA
jgi:hypothetical protein